MSALSTQLALRAHELLKDGEWRRFDDVVRELGKLVPPGIAKRRNERDRRGVRHKAKGSGDVWMPPEQRQKPRSIEEQIESGRRAIVREHLVNPAVYEFDRPGRAGVRDPDRRIRLIGEHRALHGDPLRLHRDKLAHENERLREQLDAAHEAVLELATLINPEKVTPSTAALVLKLRDAGGQ